MYENMFYPRATRTRLVCVQDKTLVVDISTFKYLTENLHKYFKCKSYKYFLIDELLTNIKVNTVMIKCMFDFSIKY